MAEERFFRHRGNAGVVRQDLQREQSVAVSLRTVAPFRRLLAAEAKATVRFDDFRERQAVRGRRSTGAVAICPQRCGGGSHNTTEDRERQQQEEIMHVKHMAIAVAAASLFQADVAGHRPIQAEPVVGSPLAVRESGPARRAEVEEFLTDIEARTETMSAQRERSPLSDIADPFDPVDIDRRVRATFRRLARRRARLEALAALDAVVARHLAEAARRRLLVRNGQLQTRRERLAAKLDDLRR